MIPVFEQVTLEMNRAYLANIPQGVDAAVAYTNKVSTFGVNAANEFAAHRC